jgi:hypothetical protein
LDVTVKCRHHLTATNPKDENTINGAKPMLLDDLLCDLQAALEEFEIVVHLLQVAELLLVNRGHGCLSDQHVANYCYAILTQAVAVADCSHDMIKLYPEQLEEEKT